MSDQICKLQADPSAAASMRAKITMTKAATARASDAMADAALDGGVAGSDPVHSDTDGDVNAEGECAMLEMASGASVGAEGALDGGVASKLTNSELDRLAGDLSSSHEVLEGIWDCADSLWSSTRSNDAACSM